MSTHTMFSRFTPSSGKYVAQVKPAAPQPHTTTRTSSMRLPDSSSAFSSPAPAMMAVPC